MYGLTDEEVAAIRQGTAEGFSPAEAALLQMADAMAVAPASRTISMAARPVLDEAAGMETKSPDSSAP